MLKTEVPIRKYTLLADAIIALLIGTTIFGIVSFGHEWRAEFNPKDGD